MEALGSQGVPAQYIKILRELYTKISQPKFYHSTTTLTLTSKEELGKAIQTRFADDIVLKTLDISQAERMLVDFDKACARIGLRLNLVKAMFMRNGLASYATFTRNGKNISECSSYVYLGREINMMSDLASELSRRKRVAWEASKSIEDVEFVNDDRSNTVTANSKRNCDLTENSNTVTDSYMNEMYENSLSDYDLEDMLKMERQLASIEADKFPTAINNDFLLESYHAASDLERELNGKFLQIT
uniref:Reverse transcriptase domain-containing protein n=1 Tax=Angiostrongylus cantonensis TaxID=6313 RepID=A0A0K0CYJ1_ANGCA